MAIPKKFTDLFGTDTLKDVLGGIDNLFTSAEERATIKAQLIRDVLEVRKSELDAASKVIVSEAQGASWLQRNWRPLGMLVFIFIVLYNYVLRDLLGMMVEGLPELEIPPGMWALLTTGFGGYVVGRSAEKVAMTVSGSKLFTGEKIDKRTNKALLTMLKKAQKKGDQETVDKILSIIGDRDLPDE